MRFTRQERMIFFMLGLVLSIFFFVDCGGRPSRMAPEMMQHRIVASEIYRNHLHWWNSPYFRIGDSARDYPLFLLINEARYGCIVPPSVWALAMDGISINCPSGWRSPRGRR